jgi:hypothetical protein
LKTFKPEIWARSNEFDYLLSEATEEDLKRAVQRN